MKQVILEDTETLLSYQDKLNEIFLKVKEKNEAEDFYTVVKPMADEIKELADKWKDEVIDWIKKEKPKYLHPNQIENTYDNVLAVSVQAFFPDTSKKRFTDLIRSNQYILQSIILKLETT